MNQPPEVWPSLQRFLSHHPELSWVHYTRAENYQDCSKSLNGLVTSKTQSPHIRNLQLSMKKISSIMLEQDSDQDEGSYLCWFIKANLLVDRIEDQLLDLANAKREKLAQLCGVKLTSSFLLPEEFIDHAIVNNSNASVDCFLFALEVFVDSNQVISFHLLPQLTPC